MNSSRENGCGVMMRHGLVKFSFLILLLMSLVSCGAVKIDTKVLSDEGLSTTKQFSAAGLPIKHIQALAPTFEIDASYPYIITGDLNASKLLFWKGRIQRSQRALKRQFFKNDPKQIITIWLFKSSESYSKYNQQFWSTIPATNYGYYLPPAKRMVMNIGSGGGTLTHELVHPYIKENFPQSPLWFHEGLASLYEQSRYSNGKIFGVNNWRLIALQSAIKLQSLSDLSTMMKSSDSDFYGLSKELNYAQARYLMFYLQSKGQLENYYKLYSENIATDPSGISSLLTVTGQKNMQSLESDWLKFVANQRY